MDKQARVYVAGHAGLIGSALVRQLRARGYRRLITRPRAELDLTNQAQVAAFFATARPECVLFAAGRTGGVYANSTYRGEFLYENLMMAANVIHQAYLHEVRKLVYFGCSSMYPRLCPQPITENAVLTGPLEPTNEPFAVAKIAGARMCESYNRQYGTDFLTLIPANIYGPDQRYDPMNSLVVPALMRRMHDARLAGAAQIEVWGSGRQARDFLYVDDLADATCFLLEQDPVDREFNVGTGRDYTIHELADILRRVVRFPGEIVFDPGRPEGVPTRLQDVTRLTTLGWTARTGLEEGLRSTYRDYLSRQETTRGLS